MEAGISTAIVTLNSFYFFAIARRVLAKEALPNGVVHYIWFLIYIVEIMMFLNLSEKTECRFQVILTWQLNSLTPSCRT